MLESNTLQVWAQTVIAEQITAAAETLASYCQKPRSAERLHRARKGLARLRAALQDLGTLAGATHEFLDRIYELHRRAGKVRDADVLVSRVDEYLKNAASDERHELRALRAALQKRRKRARRKMERAVRELPELRG
jgi:CHAD domain-containing protein